MNKKESDTVFTIVSIFAIVSMYNLKLTIMISGQYSFENFKDRTGSIKKFLSNNKGN